MNATRKIPSPLPRSTAREVVRTYAIWQTEPIGPTDILAPAALTQVAADMFRRLGMNMDFALSDWGTVIQRRTSREPVEKGGWSVLCTASSSFDQASPRRHSASGVRTRTSALPGRGRLWRNATAAGLGTSTAMAGIGQSVGMLGSGSRRGRPAPMATSVRTISPARRSTPRALS